MIERIHSFVGFIEHGKEVHAIYKYKNSMLQLRLFTDIYIESDILGYFY